MEDKKQLLKQLKQRFEELKPITRKGFDTSEELQKYKEKNREVFEEYYDIGEQIEQLEWELMSPEERKAEEETLRLMKEKRQGKIL